MKKFYYFPVITFITLFIFSINPVNNVFSDETTKNPSSGVSKVIVPDEKPHYIAKKNDYIASGWIAEECPGVGKIVKTPTSRALVARGDLIYIESDKGLAIGDKFYSIRKGRDVEHPVTEDELGYQLKITGVVEVIEMTSESNVAKAMITASFEDVVTDIGEKIMPYEEMEAPLVPDDPRTPDIEGYIVESFNNSEIAGIGDIVYLDKGSDDGIQVGDVFSTVTLSSPFESTVSGDDVQIERLTGILQIFALQPKTSKATIMKSYEVINIGDKWRKKK